jgi:SAM-dependent methyltransferase
MGTASLCSDRPAVPVAGRSRGPLRALIEFQKVLSHRFDTLLPDVFRRDGNRDFLDNLVPRYLQPGSLVYDIGGGKNPVITPGQKSSHSLKVVGLDIDDGELASAPVGIYDRTICADITSYCGRRDADIVISQALLEHVPDVDRAMAAIASILRPGGLALLFIPSRNAVYARINNLLPQRLKCRLLFWIFPEMSRDHGYPAYYDHCTPSQVQQLASQHGLSTERLTLYFTSDYFRFCLPLHVLWRCWLLFFRKLLGADAAETFSLVLRRAGEPGGAS